MKKIIFIIISIVVMLLIYVNVNAEEISIPGSAIRFRVVADSNRIEDQSMKMLVKEYIDDYLGIKMMESTDVNSARMIIESELNNISDGIELIFKENNYNKDFVISYGNNFFPKKLYKGISYDEGMYESLVITIGNGEGDNWWCVLFPPLCLLEVQESELNDVEYQFFVKSLIEKIFE